MVWTAGAALTAAQLNLYAPQAWSAYAPTLNSGIGPGNGTASGRYIRVGQTVFFWAKFTLGSTSTVVGTPVLGLPVTAHSSFEFAALQALFLDAGSNSYAGHATLSSTSVSLFVQGGAGGAFGSVSATNPFTFAEGDSITVRGIYEAA